MKLEKIFFILSILGILILIFLAQTIIPTYIGKIKSIQSSNNKIIIEIENSSTELILFDTQYINLSKDDIIEFQGRQDTYNNQPQIKVDKITLSRNPNKH